VKNNPNPPSLEEPVLNSSKDKRGDGMGCGGLIELITTTSYKHPFLGGACPELVEGKKQAME